MLVMMRCMSFLKKRSDVVFSGLPKKGKKCKAPSYCRMEDKEERSSFLRLYKYTCNKIQGVEKLTSRWGA
jgi:hypothetical protein